ncbi:copper resistance CopC family protein [Actinomadura atramentaria]|uniref:copper resistance CopC family protein n=1 Tax=Actinomadura atramentaria TaxID=1990 RepID=UPI000362D354|nr:copper resistance CopC family protein [Actinomadura atramentaria]
MSFRTPRPRRLAPLGLSAATAVLGLGVLFASPASADTRLVASDPAEGASVAAPAQVTLTFSGAVKSAQVTVTDADGGAVQDGTAAASGAKVVQKLKGGLDAGAYTITYHAVGADGAALPVGELGFLVADGGATAPPGLAPAESTEQPQDAPPTTEAGKAIDTKKAAEKDSGSGVPVWVWIVGGGVIGIAIGVGIVFRAKRRHPASGGGAGDD